MKKIGIHVYANYLKDTNHVIRKISQLERSQLKGTQLERRSQLERSQKQRLDTKKERKYK